MRFARIRLDGDEFTIEQGITVSAVEDGRRFIESGGIQIAVFGNLPIPDTITTGIVSDGFDQASDEDGEPIVLWSGDKLGEEDKINVFFVLELGDGLMLDASADPFSDKLHCVDCGEESHGDLFDTGAIGWINEDADEATRCFAVITGEVEGEPQTRSFIISTDDEGFPVCEWEEDEDKNEGEGGDDD